MKNLKKKLAVVAAGGAAALASSVSFAQASGVDPAPIVASVNGLIPTITAVGGALVGVIVAILGFKKVFSFLGR
ncbi:major capsid protein [Burkholderia thailandensis]|uniref:major capsid protein n=1 Tax=Burkholderia thailandensis TaxID=57975 RepID=UPI0005B71306|nr:major capsid protein [Burkholderia thailandensis]AVR09755.1 hypothetical protein A8H31_20510 [Burkholderia thailandensis]KIS56660.1 putative membrane protein [Burkholderia thailandensis Phuket 4W-1]